MQVIGSGSCGVEELVDERRGGESGSGSRATCCNMNRIMGPTGSIRWCELPYPLSIVLLPISPLFYRRSSLLSLTRSSRHFSHRLHSLASCLSSFSDFSSGCVTEVMIAPDSQVGRICGGSDSHRSAGESSAPKARRHRLKEAGNGDAVESIRMTCWPE